MIAALVIGTLLAVGALAFVLYPVFFPDARAPSASLARSASNVWNASSANESGEPDLSGESAIAALREIEFDRATGKLSEGDYAELKARYTRQAIEAMRQESTSSALTAGAPAAASPRAGFPSDDEIEAAVRAYRQRQAGCPACGPRPESDAIFCSNCGRYLNGRCAGCGAPVVALDARYCVSCGSRLAA